MEETQKILDGVYNYVISTINQRRAQVGRAELNDVEKAEIKQYIDTCVVVSRTKCFEATTIYDDEYIRRSTEANCADPTIKDLIRRYVGIILS